MAQNGTRKKKSKGDKMSIYNEAKQLAELLDISVERSLASVVKARLVKAIIDERERSRLTHAELARRSGLPRSAVTGILSGSLKHITIDRLLRLAVALKLMVEFEIRKAA